MNGFKIFGTLVTLAVAILAVLATILTGMMTTPAKTALANVTSYRAFWIWRVDWPVVAKASWLSVAILVVGLLLWFFLDRRAKDRWTPLGIYKDSASISFDDATPVLRQVLGLDPVKGKK